MKYILTIIKTSRIKLTKLKLKGKNCNKPKVKGRNIYIYIYIKLIIIQPAQNSYYCYDLKMSLYIDKYRDKYLNRIN